MKRTYKSIALILTMTIILNFPLGLLAHSSAIGSLQQSLDLDTVHETKIEIEIPDNVFVWRGKDVEMWLENSKTDITPYKTMSRFDDPETLSLLIFQTENELELFINELESLNKTTGLYAYQKVTTFVEQLPSSVYHSLENEQIGNLTSEEAKVYALLTNSFFCPNCHKTFFNLGWRFLYCWSIFSEFYM